jgi:GNAT superfamily N-acetyltransferase
VAGRDLLAGTSAADLRRFTPGRDLLAGASAEELRRAAAELEEEARRERARAENIRRGGLNQPAMADAGGLTVTAATPTAADAQVRRGLGIQTPPARRQPPPAETTERLGLDRAPQADIVEARRDIEADKPKYQSFGSAILAGLDDLGMLTSSAFEAVGEVMGADALASAGRRGREDFSEAAVAHGPRGSFSDIETVGDALAWARQGAGNLIPVMIPGIAGGAAGAVGGTIGAVAGAFVPSAALGVGEVQAGMKEKDPDAEADGWVFAGGTAIGALDSLLPGQIGGKLLGKFGREAAEEIALRAMLRPATRTMVEGGKGAALEGLTESLQEAIGEVTASLAAEKKINWEALPEQMLEAGALGALMGGGIGAATGAVEGVSDSRSQAATQRAEQIGVNQEAMLRMDPDTVPSVINPARPARQAPGLVETARAPAATPEDIASPIPTSFIEAGRQAIATGQARSAADGMLQENGLPYTGSRVSVTIGDSVVEGTIEDAFTETDAELGEIRGVKIRLADGRLMSESFADLADAGVQIAAVTESLPAPSSAGTAPPSGGTAGVPSPVADGGADFDLAGYMAKNRAAESGGNDAAKAATSSATGRYQFTKGTWLDTYRRTFGDTGEGEAQILAKRLDGATQDRVMETLTRDNVEAVERAGAEATDGNVYLAHFLGQGGAASVLRADPNTPVSELLTPAQINANKSILQGKTAGDVIAWAARKMGVAAPTPGQATEEAAPIVPPEQPDYSWMESEPANAEPSDVPAEPEGPSPFAGVRGEIERQLAQEPVAATVPQEDAPDEGLGPASVLDFQPPQGEPGVTVAVEDGELATAVFRDADGRAQGVVQLPLTPAAREMTGGVSSFVRPQFRRQGVATRLYDALRDAGHPIDVESGSSDLTPAGAAFVNARRGVGLRDTPSGDTRARLEPTARGVALIDATDTQIAAIRAAGIKVPPARKSDGARVFSAQAAEAVRSVIEAPATPTPEPAPASPLAAAPGGGGLTAPAAPSSSAQDMLTFIARNGGISLDGLNEQGRKAGTLGHDLGNSGAIPRFVPRAGAVLKKNGRSLDEMGELLWDAGYFGPPATTPRPTDGEIINLLDELGRTKQKRYSFFDQAPEARVDPAEYAEPANDNADLIATMRAWLPEAAEQAPEVLEYAADLAVEQQMPIEQALAIAVGRYVDATIETMIEENPDGGYGGLDEYPQLGIEDRPSAAGGAGFEAVGGDAQASVDRGGDDRAARGEQDEPAGLDRGEAVDPAIADRQRQVAQLRAEAPMRAREEQDGTMGLGLFDANDQPDLLSGTTRNRRASGVVDADAPSAEATKTALRARLAEIGLDRSVAIDFLETIFAGDDDIAGTYRNAAITVAMNARQDAMFTLNHEAIHALKDLRLIKPAEWSALRKAVVADRPLMADVERRYPDLDREAQIEEAVADRFAAWAAERAQERGFIAAAFQRIRNVLDALRDALGGFPSADSVFRAIEAGRIGRRAQAPANAQTKESRPGSILARNAAPNPDTIATITEAARKLVGNSGGTRAKIGAALDDWRTAAQDRMLPLLRAQATVEKAIGRPLADHENPYRAEELMSGKVGAQLEKLAERYVEPLFEALRETSITVDELESFLYARHAPERNAQIARINPGFAPGEGSGMSDIQAAAILRRLERSGRRADFDRVAAFVDGMRDETQRIRVETGLISQEQADEWTALYPNYVPLRGMSELVEGERPRQGQGISVRGKESKRAFGRRSMAEDILAYSIMQAEEAIIRGHKNEVAQQFYSLAEAAPDEDFWTLNKITETRKIDEDTGLVKYVANNQMTAEDAPFTVSLKIEGKERRVTLNRANPEAVRVAETMRRLNEPEIAFLTKVGLTINRWLSMANTSLNPEFVITNAFRDLQTALVNVTEFDVDGMRRGIMRDYLPALKGSAKGMFGRTDGEWGRWFREFTDEGGRVYYNQVQSVDELRADIEKRFAKMQRQSGALAATPKEMALQAKGAIEAVYGYIDRVNSGVENAIRLAAYKNAREAGMSKPAAASLAKNLTVNFNRRGSRGTVINALYLFYNASVQGSFRILTAMKHKKVRQLAYGMVATGAALEMLNMMASGTDDDDELFYDKISDFDKSRNLIIMEPGSSRYIKIPLPYGFNAFYAAGRAVVEAGRGKRSKAAVFGDLFTTVADAFNPIGGSGNILNIIAPTVVDPAVDLVLNRDYADRPIKPDQSQYGPEVPDAQRYWGSVGPLWQNITDGLTKLTGGDEVVAGGVDVSPETLEYMFGVVAGAAGSFIDRSAGSVWKLIDGDPETMVTLNDVPFARKIIGTTPDWYDKSAFYTRLDTIDQTVAETKQYLEGGNIEGARAYAQENATILGLRDEAKVVRKEMKDVKALRSQLEVAHKDGRITDDQMADGKAKLAERETRAITAMNKLWNGYVGVD